jgi:hypothetical protein
MPRDPLPSVGSDFDGGFSAQLASALAINPAIHDGAIMVQRQRIGDPYRILGWSYRLRAPLPKGSVTGLNRGSAFNSCLATSSLSGVDAVYLVSQGRMTCFVNGSEAWK